MFDSVCTTYEKAIREMSLAEDLVMEVFDDIGLTLCDWKNFNYDPYDGRLTIEGCNSLSKEQAAKLREHGFTIIDILTDCRKRITI